jgi:hypothetical protein
MFKNHRFSTISNQVNLTLNVAILNIVLKKRKYKSLSDNYFFVAFDVETLGPWSNDARSLLDELGKLLSNTTGRYFSGENILPEAAH